MYKTDQVRKHLIHCITNPIAMNQSANAILALGARPIMAEHPAEVEDITANADSLLLNLGNINDTRLAAMEKSIKVANEKRIPVVLDLVGVACSKLRRDFSIRLLEEYKVSVIKGNYSEIVAMYTADYWTDGVDADELPADVSISDIAKELGAKYSAIILATGESDVVSDGKRLQLITGGCSQMSLVTGTGCMLGAIITTFMPWGKPYEMVIGACKLFKKCGEDAAMPEAPGTFMVKLLDSICVNKKRFLV